MSVLTQCAALMFIGLIPINQICIEVNLHLLHKEQFACRLKYSNVLWIACIVERVSRNFGKKRPTGNDFL
jgi:hypothetical protein